MNIRFHLYSDSVLKGQLRRWFGKPFMMVNYGLWLLYQDGALC